MQLENPHRAFCRTKAVELRAAAVFDRRWCDWLFDVHPTHASHQRQLQRPCSPAPYLPRSRPPTNRAKAADALCRSAVGVSASTRKALLCGAPIALRLRLASADDFVQIVVKLSTIQNV